MDNIFKQRWISDVTGTAVPPLLHKEEIITEDGIHFIVWTQVTHCPCKDK